jgi:sugar lactone lactonase YvrE
MTLRIATTTISACSAVLLACCGTAKHAEHAPSPSREQGAPAAATAPVASAARARPSGWAAPEVMVAPSSFHGVHGVAIDKQGRLLAGTIVGHDMWEVDRTTGAAKVFIAAPEGEADDIAIGPKGELAWTSFSQGIVRFRENDGAPIRELAKGLAGINSIAFDAKRKKLYASQVFMGDALWEIDLAGKRAPRSIAKDLGGFNGFEVGPDGQLYGPLWFKGQVVKIDPANGKVTPLNAEFKTPAAANLDGKGNLWVLDTKAGTLNKIELANGQKTEVAKLRTSLDNLAIAPEGTIYISNMADNSIQTFDPSSGDLKTLTQGKLCSPGGIKLDGDSLLIADVFAFRSLDIQSGEVRDVYRAYDSKLASPGAVGLGAKLIALSAWSTGTVQLLDRASKQDVEMLHDLKAPMDAIPLADGSLLIAEIASGAITRATGAHYEERSVLAKDLAGPTQMILGKDGALYVTEAAGRLTRIELGTGAKSVVAQDLVLPEGLAETPWHTFIVAEAAAQRLTEIDPRDGSKRSVAEKLPIGLTPGLPGMPPAYITTGVAVSDDGSVFVTADLDQSLLRIRPQ